MHPWNNRKAVRHPESDGGPSRALLRRTGELKQQLSEYARSDRFKREYDQAFHDRYGEGKLFLFDDELPGGGDYTDFVEFLDSFLLEHRLNDGRTLVDHFVEDHPELPESERQMLLSWQEPVTGVFEVQDRKGSAAYLSNLVDELNYRAFANKGAASIQPMRRGMFVTTRLVPLGDDWLFSGTQSILPAVARADVRRVAIEMAMKFPQMAFRNPEKLQQAWDLQREQHEMFVEFFGTDLLVVPKAELRDKMRGFFHYQNFEKRDADGTTAAERAEADGKTTQLPDFDPFPGMPSKVTIGVISNPIEGISYYPDFGLIDEVFVNPELLADRKHRRAVREFLENPDGNPVPFQNLARRDPARASEVFQKLLQRPDFDWERDGEALLRQHQVNYYAKPRMPHVLPLSQRQVKWMQAPTEPGRSRRKGL